VICDVKVLDNDIHCGNNHVTHNFTGSWKRVPGVTDISDSDNKSHKPGIHIAIFSNPDPFQVS
jgi:hypothetical protein